VFLLIGFTTAHMYQRYSVVPLHLVMALVLAAPHASFRFDEHDRGDDANQAGRPARTALASER
jgi:hypothetical protein